MWFKRLRADIAAAKKNDPAARNKFEIIFDVFGGARLISPPICQFSLSDSPQTARPHRQSMLQNFYGHRNHPAAKIYPGVFIDHGSGVVIGETAEVHPGTVIYQGATLGGNGKEHGKRHPTLMENVTVSAAQRFSAGSSSAKARRSARGRWC